MRKRNIQKIVRFNCKEAQDLAAKAKKACLSEAGLILVLLSGSHRACIHQGSVALSRENLSNAAAHGAGAENRYFHVIVLL